MTHTTQQVAEDFAALCKAGKFDEAGRTYWSDQVVSIEPREGPMSTCRGRAEVEAKTAWWSANHEIHRAEAEGPFVHGDQFILRFSMDVTPKGGERMQMTETGLYTVKDGKVVEERFFY